MIRRITGAAAATMLMTAAPAMAQDGGPGVSAPHSCPSATGVSAQCVDDPTGVLLSDGANRGYVLVGGDPAAQKGEAGVCARNPQTPSPAPGQGGPGYYFLVLANPPSPGQAADCPGATPPPPDDYGRPKPKPEPEPDPPADDPEPPPEPPAQPPAKNRPEGGQRAKLKRCLKKAEKADNRRKERKAKKRCRKRFGD